MLVLVPQQLPVVLLEDDDDEEDEDLDSSDPESEPDSMAPDDILAQQRLSDKGPGSR